MSDDNFDYKQDRIKFVKILQLLSMYSLFDKSIDKELIKSFRKHFNKNYDLTFNQKRALENILKHFKVEDFFKAKDSDDKNKL